MFSLQFSFLTRLIGSIFVILALCWPAFYNGQPFYYPDTVSYFTGADSAFNRALGIETRWTKLRARYGGVVAKKSDAPSSGDSEARQDHENVSGRSIYYGVTVYLAELLGGAWLPVFGQALIVALSIFLTARLFFRDPWLPTAITVTGLAIVTPLGFFSSMLLPDLFAGFTILAFSNIFLFWQRMSLRERVFWCLLLTFAVSAHSSHLLLCAMLVSVAALYTIIFARSDRCRWKGLGLVALVFGLGFLAEVIFQQTIKHVFGKSAIRPAFVMARVIADGPGYKYIKATCPENGFRVCAFQKNLPVANADVFLWHKEPDEGVFAIAPFADRRAMSNEQIAFAMRVFLFDPLGQISATLSNIKRQLLSYQLTEFNYIPGFKKYMRKSLPPEYLEQMRQTPAYRNVMPTAPFVWLTHAAVILSIIFLVIIHWRNNMSGEKEPGPLGAYAAFILLGILLNACITGAISEVHDRYQARVIWLLPLLAAFIGFYCRLQDRSQNPNSGNLGQGKSSGSSDPIGHGEFSVTALGSKLGLNRFRVSDTISNDPRN